MLSSIKIFTIVLALSSIFCSLTLLPMRLPFGLLFGKKKSAAKPTPVPLAQLDEKTKKELLKKTTHAASRGDIKDLEELSQIHLPLLTMPNERGATALSLACHHGQLEVVRWLLAKTENKFQSVLLKTKRGSLESTPLHVAAYKGHPEIIQTLLDAWAHVANVVNLPSFNNRTPLHYAVANGQIEAMAVLLKNGANIFKAELSEQTPLSLALENKNPDVFEEIQKSLPLIEYAKKGDIEAVKKLLALPIDLERTDPTYHATALIWAANNGCDTVVETLLKAGAKVTAKNNEGFTALECAQKIAIVKTNMNKTPFCEQEKESYQRIENMLKETMAQSHNPAKDKQEA